MPTTKKVDPRLGSLKDKTDKRDYKFSTVVPETPSLPPVVDWESSMTKVKNQGSRGACVAFGTVGAKEWQEKKERNGKEVILSEAWIYEQIREPGGGSYPRNALKVITDYGVCLGKLLPYDSTISDNEPRTIDLSTNEGKKKVRRQLGNAKNYRIQGFARLGSHQDIMQAIAFNGPIVVGMLWLTDWTKPSDEPKKNGYPILQWKENPEGVAGRHMYVICGYDLSDPKKPLYKIRNSWGTTWGKGGYAYIEQSCIWKANADVWAVYDTKNPLVSSKGVSHEKNK